MIKSLTNKYKKALTIVLFLVLSIALSVIYTKHNEIRSIDSYDILFHLNRIMSLDNIFQSPVNFKYWRQTGNLTSVFYPWLSAYPGYLIMSLFSNKILGFGVFIAVITFVNFVVSFFCAKLITKNYNESLLFSILYTYALFRLTSLFYRASVPEYIAYILLPIIFTTFYKLSVGEYRYWPIFSLAMGFLLYTHPLTTFLTVLILLVIFVCIVLKKIKDKEFIVNYIKYLFYSGISFVVVILGYAVSYLEQVKYQKISHPVVVHLIDSAQPVKDLVKNSFSLDIRMYGVGPILVLAVILVLIFIWKDKFEYQIVGLIVLITYFSCSTLVPWSKLQNTIFQTIQFPWRFLSLFVLFASIYIAHFIFEIIPNKNWRIVIGTVVGLATVFIGLRSTIVEQRYEPLTTITESNFNNKVANAEIASSMDYYPLKSKESQPKNTDSIGGHKIKINKSIHRIKKNKDYHVDSNNYYLNLDVAKKSKVDLPVLYYVGFVASDNGKIIESKESKRGTILLNLKNGSHHIKITYFHTKLSLFATTISIVMILWLIVLIVNKFYRKKS